MKKGIPDEAECLATLAAAGCDASVVRHCRTVHAVAAEIAAGIPGADGGLVAAGALLHDIGRSRDNTIMHATVGADMLAGMGFPDELVEIVRRHTGAGLDDADVREYGLPPGDYIPRTIEQKIVAHADNLVSRDRVVRHSRSVEKLRAKGADRGADRMERLHSELSALYGADIDEIAKRMKGFSVS
ncbi:MAG: HDIG domain-containing protein [Candidatus Methanoplasma sp.]|nr:HDIG domain-containing protein [Candidatus Methanoplasma sp.]